MEEFRLKQSEISAMLSDQEEEQSLFISDRQTDYVRSDAPFFREDSPSTNLFLSCVFEMLLLDFSD